MILFTHLLKLVKSVGTINLLRQLRIPVGRLDALPSRPGLSVFLWEKHAARCPGPAPWQGASSYERPAPLCLGVHSVHGVRRTQPSRAEPNRQPNRTEPRREVSETSRSESARIYLPLIHRTYFSNEGQTRD